MKAGGAEADFASRCAASAELSSVRARVAGLPQYKAEVAELATSLARASGGGGGAGGEEEDDIQVESGGYAELAARVKCPLTKKTMVDPVRASEEWGGHHWAKGSSRTMVLTTMLEGG